MKVLCIKNVNALNHIVALNIDKKSGYQPKVVDFFLWNSWSHADSQQIEGKNEMNQLTTVCHTKKKSTQREATGAPIGQLLFSALLSTEIRKEKLSLDGHFKHSIRFPFRSGRLKSTLTNHKI